MRDPISIEFLSSSHLKIARKDDHHPGELLRDVVLPALRLSVSQAARDLGVTRQTLHRVLAGQAAISTEMAMRLEKLCGIPSLSWIELQHRYEARRLSDDDAAALMKIPEHALPSDVAKRLGARNE